LISDNYGDQSNPDYQAPFLAKVQFQGVDLQFLHVAADTGSSLAGATEVH
jgi:hypothetical protein